jgi:hypothetical protein
VFRVNDVLLIVLILALFGLGFIPVAALLKYLGKNRRYTSEHGDSHDGQRTKPASEPIEELERTGMLYFDPEDDGAPKSGL